ncbi:MAG TPA: S8 family serine peptidase [Clostridiales bacterium]|nr:S8 family serine peptidase [Clostridiales bacterium]
MQKFLSLTFGILFFLSSYFPALSAPVDLLSLALTGVPYYNLQTSSDFLENIDDSDIREIGDGTGFVKDILLVFLEKNTSLFKRYEIFKSVGGFCVGYLEPANLFVLRAPFDDLAGMERAVSVLTEKDKVLFAGGSFAFKRVENYTPNDPFDSLLDGSDFWDESVPQGSTWWLEAVEARNAWGYSPLFSGIKIGVVDSGFALDHEELTGKISFPKAWLKARNRPAAHGTHVSGMIAAKADNGVGISGLAHHSDLVCIDWKREAGQVWSEELSIVFGVGYAIKAGAKVINLSLGASASLPDGKSSYPKYALDYEAGLISFYMAALLNQGYDFLIVQSAGNGDSNGKPVDAFNNGTFCCINAKNTKSTLLGVPVRQILDRIIVVGSAEHLYGTRFRQARSSNVGYQVDICAPGVGIYSSSTAENDFYQYMSGTSMAAPVVTATAGLVWSVNPKLSGDQVKSIICNPSNTRYMAEIGPERFWSHLNYREIDLVNSKLSVEAAIKTAHDIFTVQGRVTDNSDIPTACEIYASSDLGAFRFSVASDGIFDFVLPAGEYSLVFQKDDSRVTMEFDAEKDELIDLGQVSL